MGKSDNIVFISNWLKQYFCNKYKNIPQINKLNNAFVINNGCDLSIFTTTIKKPINSSKIRLVTHHWSDNYNKGFYIYNKIDKLLETNKNIEFTYIGRYNKDYQPKNIRLLKPMYGKELGNELRKHDIYITASLNEPGGMHQLEGMASGMPILYRKGSGGIKETVFGCGEEFSEIKDFLVKLKKIIKNYQYYQSKINLDFIDANRMNQEFYNLLKSITSNKT